MSSPDAQTPAPPQAAQTDLLGEATPMQPASASVPTPGASNVDVEVEKKEGSDAKPAQDENQAGFIGERNMPKA